jgi:hypothetical protein
LDDGIDRYFRIKCAGLATGSPVYQKADAAPVIREGIVHLNRTIERRISLSPTIEYSPPGGLREAPDHAASSSPEAKNLRKWEVR